MVKYKDVADEPEDDRIRQIGEAAMTGQVVAFVTDSDPGKAERYIQKLTSRFPQIRVLKRFNGPVPGTVTVKVSRRNDRN